jgi:SAM-dependent methyltransferase
MERYTPGDSTSVTAFMARRTLASHGAFLRPFLWKGARVLDSGCGPGTITAGIAGCVAPGGSVYGIDANPAQVEIARGFLADTAGIELRCASVYELPFADGEFDVVFSHALFEHLADPRRAAGEIRRVLRSGGIVALRSPDFTGCLAGPPDNRLEEALRYYERLQESNGGNLRVGRSLGAILVNSGFEWIRSAATYECYAPVSLIAEYLARQVEASAGAEASELAAVLQNWGRSESSFFAQAWCEVVGQKP